MVLQHALDREDSRFPLAQVGYLALVALFDALNSFFGIHRAEFTREPEPLTW